MVTIKIKPQKNAEGVEIDKIATVTREIITQKTFSISGTELTRLKGLLQTEIDTMAQTMDEYDEIEVAMNG